MYAQRVVTARSETVVSSRMLCASKITTPVLLAAKVSIYPTRPLVLAALVCLVQLAR